MIKQSPYTYTIDSIEGEGSAITKFEMSLVYSRRQLMESLDFDVKLNVRVKTVTVDGFLKVIEKTTFDENSLVLVIKAQTEYGRTSIKNLKLTKEAKKIYKKSTTEFINLYGTKIPVMKRHGASVYLICTIDNISESRKKEIQSSLTIEKKALTFSAKVESHLNKSIFEAKQSGNFKFDIISTGGTGLDRLSDIIKKVDTTNAESSFTLLMRDGIGEYFKQFNFKNSAPLGFFCESYKNLGLRNISENDLSRPQLKILTNIVALYREKDELLNRFNLILKDLDPISNLLSTKDKQEIETKIIPALVIYLENLSTLHAKYLEEEPKPNDKIPYFVFEDLPYLKYFDVAIKIIPGNSEPSDLRDDPNYKFDYQISGKYLSSVIIECKSPDFQLNGDNFLTISKLVDPSFTQRISPTPPFQDIIIAKDVVTVKNTFFSTLKFKTDLEASVIQKIPANTNPRIDIYITALNTVGYWERRKIMTIYLKTPTSNSNIIYKINQ